MCLTCLGATMMVSPTASADAGIFTTELPQPDWTGLESPLGGAITCAQSNNAKG